jgi:polysaccharide export outer membrane protein
MNPAVPIAPLPRPDESARSIFLQAAVVAIILSLGCAGAGPATPTQHVGTESTDTTLGPGDVFDVRVYGEEDLSSTYRVASDGTIDYPLIGTVNVDGLTPTDITKLLERKLLEGDFLKKPHVSILVKEYNSKKISVFGQVNKPGTFPYEEGMNVVEGISRAGGFTSMARPNDTTVTRVVSGAERKFKVPVEAIGQGRASNFILRPGDIIFIPERIF